jgi:hopanoid biosynthesis associated protein HpnK
VTGQPQASAFGDDAVPSPGTRRLVVVADDFGRTPGVNQAVAEAFDRGIVTSASVMAGGTAFAEAAALARARPRLAIGLHATFCDGRAVLPADRIPGLVDGDGRLEPDPARAGIRYWRERRRLQAQICIEIAAQFDRAEDAGLEVTYADGHHHLHVHPLLFAILCREAERRSVRWIRIPAGDLRDGRLSEWALFGMLGLLNRRTARRRGLRTPDRVHGLSRTGRIDEPYVIELLERLRPGWNELFVHPDLETEQGRRELKAVTSPRVRERIARLGIALVAYDRTGGDAPGPGGGPS